MKRIYLLLARVCVIALIGVAAFPFLVNRKPMAINIVNHLQGTPQSLLRAVQEKRPLDERKAWEAVQYYEDRLLLAPGDIGALTSLGYLFVEMQAYPKALSMYQQALKENPGLFGIRYDLAFVQYKMGNVKAAYQILSELLKLPPVMAQEGFLCFIGGSPLSEQNARAMLIKVSRIAAVPANVPVDVLTTVFKGFFDDGLFYFVSLRGYNDQGKMGYTIF